MPITKRTGRSLSRKRGGARAFKAGRDFEQSIELWLENAAAARLVEFWTHTGPHFVRAGKNRFVPSAAGVADYTGVLRGGLAFALEVKSTTSKRFDRASISKKQGEHLDAVARAGGAALLAIEFRDPKTGLRASYLVPWTAVPWEMAISAYTLRAQPLRARGYEIRPTNFLRPHLTICDTCAAAWPKRPGGRTCSHPPEAIT